MKSEKLWQFTEQENLRNSIQLDEQISGLNSRDVRRQRRLFARHERRP